MPNGIVPSMVFSFSSFFPFFFRSFLILLPVMPYHRWGQTKLKRDTVAGAAAVWCRAAVGHLGPPLTGMHTTRPASHGAGERAEAGRGSSRPWRLLQPGLKRAAVRCRLDKTLLLAPMASCIVHGRALGSSSLHAALSWRHAIPHPTRPDKAEAARSRRRSRSASGAALAPLRRGRGKMTPADGSRDACYGCPHCFIMCCPGHGIIPSPHQ